MFKQEINKVLEIEQAKVRRGMKDCKEAIEYVLGFLHACTMMGEITKEQSAKFASKFVADVTNNIG